MGEVELEVKEKLRREHCSCQRLKRRPDHHGKCGWTAYERKNTKGLLIKEQDTFLGLEPSKMGAV
jgi:hypothetical protein